MSVVRLCQFEEAQRGGEKRGRCKEKETEERYGLPLQVNYLSRGSCVYQPPGDQSKPQGVAFLHPPLIQLHLARSTRWTKLENFLTAVDTQRVWSSQAVALGLQNRTHKTEITTLKDKGQRKKTEKEVGNSESRRAETKRRVRLTVERQIDILIERPTTSPRN